MEQVKLQARWNQRFHRVEIYDVFTGMIWFRGSIGLPEKVAVTVAEALCNHAGFGVNGDEIKHDYFPVTQVSRGDVAAFTTEEYAQSLTDEQMRSIADGMGGVEVEYGAWFDQLRQELSDIGAEVHDPEEEEEEEEVQNRSEQEST